MKADFVKNLEKTVIVTTERNRVWLKFRNAGFVIFNRKQSSVQINEDRFGSE